MSVGTKLYTWLHGELVGRDQFGNRYYRAKGGAKRSDLKERRWVLYEGEPEASRVPPYRPPGDLLKGGHRPSATGDYEPWVPS